MDNQIAVEIGNALDSPVVVPFPSKHVDGKRKWDQMWGKSVVGYGYVALPRLLLDGQRRLGLNATQMLILIHLANQWWEPGKNPWPSKARLANSLGLSSRKQRFRANKGQTSNEFDLSGLVLKLQQLEPEFSAARKASSEMKANVQKRGGLATP